MTRAGRKKTLPYDPEIERTIRRLGKQASQLWETTKAEPAPKEHSIADQASEASESHQPAIEMAEHIA